MEINEEFVERSLTSNEKELELALAVYCYARARQMDDKTTEIVRKTLKERNLDDDDLTVHQLREMAIIARSFALLKGHPKINDDDISVAIRIAKSTPPIK